MKMASDAYGFNAPRDRPLQIVATLRPYVVRG